MKYQNDPTKPNYNPSPQESFRYNYHLKFSTGLFISIFISNFVYFFLKGKDLNSTGKFGVWFSLGVSGTVLIYAIIIRIKYY